MKKNDPMIPLSMVIEAIMQACHAGNVGPSLLSPLRRVPAFAPRLADPADPAGGELLTMEEVCAKIGVSDATVYRYIAKARFPRAVSTGGRGRSWRLEEVERWMKRNPLKVRA